MMVGSTWWCRRFIAIGVLFSGAVRRGFSMDRCQTLSAERPACARSADLTGNGYPDLILGGHVPSRGLPHDSFVYIYWNGPEGLSEARRCMLPANGINSNGDRWISTTTAGSICMSAHTPTARTEISIRTSTGTARAQVFPRPIESDCSPTRRRAALRQTSTRTVGSIWPWQITSSGAITRGIPKCGGMVPTDSRRAVQRAYRLPGRTG